MKILTFLVLGAGTGVVVWLLIILLVMLVLFAAKKLPELARGMGQAVKEFQKAKDEFSDELNKAAKSEAETDKQGAKPAQPIVALDQHREPGALALSNEPLDNVVTRLTFGESLDSVRFATASQDAAFSGLNRLLAATGDGIVITLNKITLSKSRVTMLVSASKEGQVLIEDGAAAIARHSSGKALPLVRDVKTGQWVEVMKEAKGAKAMARLASISTAIVGAAHIISGADIAKRLKEVDAKIDLLLAYRRIDQMAALERIYTSARELSVGPMSREKMWELWHLRGELRELRIGWRRELKHQLDLIEDPNSAAWYQKMFSWIEPIDRGIHSPIHRKITEGQLHICLIEYSMRLDQALAVASRTVPAFELTLAGEVEELESLAQLLKSKGGMISSKYPELSVESTQQDLFAIAEEYRKLLPEQPVDLSKAQLHQLQYESNSLV
jgi:TatA/E family protein of Tat protein translocase